MSDENKSTLDLMKAREVAELLQVHISKVYELDIPHYRVGASYRYDPAEVRAWMEAHHYHHN